MAKIARLSLWLTCCILLFLILAGCTLLSRKSPQSAPLFIRIPPTGINVTSSKNFPLSTSTEQAMEPSSTPLPPFPTAELPKEPSSTPVILSPTPVLPVVQGDLRDIIFQLEENTPRQGSEGFVQPDDTALVDFLHLVDKLINGNYLAAAEISVQYGYELIYFRDQQTIGKEYLLLHEINSAQLGWGMFVINPEACQGPSRVLIVEAPHILSDEGTPQIALDTFRALHGCALMVAGAHRDANRDGSADVAHNPKTVFQSVQTALAKAAGPAALVLQIHGFAADKHLGYPSIVLGGSSAVNLNGAALLTSLSQSLDEHGLSTGVCDGVNWTALCGETNVLANNLPAGLFIHMEMDETARSRKDSAINSLVEVINRK